MTRSAHLDELPAGIRFPREVDGRINYNAAERCLEFEGSMSKSDFDRLLPLDNSIAYQRALEQLFQECSYSSAPARGGHTVRNSLIAAAVALVMALLAWAAS